METYIKNAHMQELLAACGLTADAESIVDITQRAWLIRNQKPPEGTTYPLHNRVKIELLASKLGYINEVKPRRTFYDYAILLGGETPTMEPRFIYLAKLAEQNISFKNLIFHAGLHTMPDYDPYKNMTEADAVRILHKKYRLNEAYPDIPHVFIDIPVSDHNPTTQDGLLYWLSQNPQPGSCLVISSQPYLNYQCVIFQTYMPAAFTVETVGPARAQTVETSEVLDCITRHLYACDHAK